MEVEEPSGDVVVKDEPSASRVRYTYDPSSQNHQSYHKMDPMSQQQEEKGIDADSFAQETLQIIIGSSDMDAVSTALQRKLSLIADINTKLKSNDISQIPNHQLMEYYHCQYWALNRVSNQR